MKMKKIKALVLFGMLVLGFYTASEPQPQFTTITITPSAPTSADQVSVTVKVIHSNFSYIKFFRPQFFSESRVFLATVFQEPEVCPFITDRLSSETLLETLASSESRQESVHSYPLGKLPSGRYEFQLQYYTCGCPFPPDFPDDTERCQPKGIVGSQEFQVTEASLERIIDQNVNGYIDDNEILNALNLWIAGGIVPGTSQTIDDTTILKLLDLWIKQIKV